MAVQGFGAAPIPGLVDDLGRRLPRVLGPRRGLLTEVRDGLEDAAEAYRSAGLDPAAAEARAVADFGPPEQVAADFAELRLTRVSRVAAVVLGPGYALVLAAWLLFGRDSTSRVPGIAFFAHAFNWLGALALVVAALTAIGLRRDHRLGRSSRRWARLVGRAGLACGVLTLASAYLVSPWDLGGGPAAPWRVLDGVETFSGVVVGTILATALWCLVADRASRGLAQPAASRTLRC